MTRPLIAAIVFVAMLAMTASMTASGAGTDNRNPNANVVAVYKQAS